MGRRTDPSVLASADPTTHPRHARLPGRLLIAGFGAIGRGVLPLLLRHLDATPAQVRILEPTDDGRGIAAACGVEQERLALTPDNHRELLGARLGPGDVLLNLTVDVGSADLVAWCQQNGVLYLDAAIEPWAGGHFDATRAPARRSNYALRQQVLQMRDARPHGPTAVLMHGVNPGLVSHFVKRALLQLAADLLPSHEVPRDRAQWAALAHRLGVRTIHVAERDTQGSRRRKARGEFVNTWSIPAFAGEACQPAELGWGSHERHWPADARRHETGSRAAIWLERPGAATRVRSWTPLEGPYHGFLITHGESISIAEYLTLADGDRLVYRPTVHYVYHPCDDAVLSLHELAGRGWDLQPRHRQLGADDIDSGMDELGVLLAGHGRNALWYGSRLTIERARELCPFNNATSLQTAAGVLGGLAWALNHPDRGIVEPDELDHDEVLAIARPYLGEMVGVYGDWTPLHDRGRLFPEDVDPDDPWQFRNVRVD
jgi:homospermidine synthase